MIPQARIQANVPSPPLDATGPGVSTRSITRFLMRWRGTLIATFALVVMLATALIYALPQVYLAEATILVERNRAPIMRADLSPGLEMAEVMNTERAIASSRTVVETVVDALNLVDRPVPDTPFSRMRDAVGRTLVSLGLWPEMSPRDAWILKVERAATIKPVVNSNILSIAIGLDDPRLSAEVANAISREYIAERVRIYSTEGLSDFYKQQADLAEASYREQFDELLEFKAANGILASSTAKTDLVAELGLLRAQLLANQNEMLGKRQRYGPDHPEVTLLAETTADVKARIEQTEADLQTVERNEALVANLEMLVDEDRRTFIGYDQKYFEARMDERAGKDVVNVRVVDEAAPPARPTMARLLVIVGAALAGVLVALGVAALREYLDARASDPDAVERALGIAVIGGLERMPRGSLRRLVAAGASPGAGR